MTARNTNVAYPGRDLDVVSHFVAHGYDFNELAAVPFMYKMRAIFKSLEIVHSGGRGVITLDDLEWLEVGQESAFSRRIVRVLEIFDLDEDGDP